MNRLLLFLIVLALFVAFFVGSALFVGRAGVWFAEPVGTILVYEIDSEIPAAQRSELVSHLILVLEGRLNPGFRPKARVRLLDDGRIEIGVFGDDPQMAAQVQGIVESRGTLEFRIVANQRDHASEIAEAMDKDVLMHTTRDGTERRRAWWVQLATSANEDFADYLFVNPHVRDDDIFLRKEIPVDQRTIGIRRGADDEGRQRLEILVVRDAYDVTGEYLTSARRDSDNRGTICLQFNFNARGGQLFGGLTGDNLPDTNPEFHRLLAIILNDRVVSAPRINGIIRSSGIITGQFTRQEIDDLASVLNAGELPASLKLVERRQADENR